MNKNNLWAFVSIGFEIVGLILVAVYLGAYLDEKYQLKGLGTGGMVIVALTGWLVRIILMLKKIQSDEESSNQQNTPKN